MDRPYALVPSEKATGSTSAQSTSHDVLQLHDSLRHGGLRSFSAEHMPKHPLQTRLEKWDETQDSLKFTLQRQIYGMHAPIRQQMERQLVSYNPHFPAFQSGSSVSDVHLDILRGKDESIDFPDVLVAAQETAPLPTVDMHSAMERKLRL